MDQAIQLWTWWQSLWNPGFRYGLSRTLRFDKLLWAALTKLDQKCSSLVRQCFPAIRNAWFAFDSPQAATIGEFDRRRTMCHKRSHCCAGRVHVREDEKSAEAVLIIRNRLKDGLRNRGNGSF